MKNVVAYVGTVPFLFWTTLKKEMDISDKYNEPDISDEILKQAQEVTVTLHICL